MSINLDVFGRPMAPHLLKLGGDARNVPQRSPIIRAKKLERLPAWWLATAARKSLASCMCVCVYVSLFHYGRRCLEYLTLPAAWSVMNGAVGRTTDPVPQVRQAWRIRAGTYL